MKFPWVNLVLLILLLVQVVTGYFGLTNGRESFSWVLWLHGIGAYGLLVLLFWKGQVILDALRRKNVWTGQRLLFISTLLLLLAVILLGLTWTFYGPIYVAGFSLVSLHIYLAIPLMLLMGWHAWQMRFIFKVRGTFERRLFLGTAVTAVLGLITWGLVRWSKKELALPGAGRRYTGSYEMGSYTGAFPTVSWIADFPPPVALEQWQLQIRGAVQRPYRLTYNQLQQMGTDEITTTLDCTGGWYTTQVWGGVLVDRLLAQAGLLEEAASVTFTAVSGYQRRFTIQEAKRYLLALNVNDQPLTHGHGFPARLVAPDQRGVNWVKWIARIQVNTSSKIWQLPLPLR